ncbi:hypothetical protein DL96DRAFT_1614054 [Flagelloscypha sp. PMI_526]|nr:hypothetical protein DL96DRAFT_1614054 [Flagelloscypha sp. PMI_526]
MIELPQELVDHVLRFASVYPSSLASLGLAHHSFTLSSRALLFERVHAGQVHFMKFSEILRRSPRVADFIRHLTIILPFDSEDIVMKYQREIITILQAATMIESFSILSDPPMSGALSHPMSNEFIDSLRTIIFRPTLRRLSLELRRMPVSEIRPSMPVIYDLLLANPTRKGILELFQYFYKESETRMADLTHPFQPLHTLRLTKLSSGILDVFFHAINRSTTPSHLSQLNRFAVSFGDRSLGHDAVSQLLGKMTALEHLSIGPALSAIMFSEMIPHTPGSVRHPVQLQHCPSLRTVHVHTMYNHNFAPPGAHSDLSLIIRPSIWLCDFLRSGQDNINLETIQITFQLPIGYTHDDLCKDDRPVAFQSVDEVLSLGTFPALKRVILVMASAQPKETIHFSRTVDYVQKAMHHLHNRRILEVRQTGVYLLCVGLNDSRAISKF